MSAASGSAPVPYKVTGPSALSGDWRRFTHLSVMLAVTDFKLRFFGSVLGYLWSLMRPLLMFGVLYAVFSVVFRFGGAVNSYPVVLLMAIVVYEYFGEATANAVQSVDRPREPRPQDPLPADGDPALDHADRGVQPAASTSSWCSSSWRSRGSSRG